jgi:hypothetical protein
MPEKKRAPRRKTSSRSKTLSKVYQEELGDEMESEFAMPATSRYGVGTLLLMVVLGVLIGGGVTFFFLDKQMNEVKKAATVEVARDANRSVEQRISDLLRFESDEKPVLATVKNMDMIKDIPLYEFAQNGDEVVVYKDMTIIYDSERDRIVSAVPQSVLREQVATEEPAEDDETTDDNSEAADTTDSDDTTADVLAKDVKVEVRNGTATSGLAGKNATKIKSDLGYTTTAANAAKNTYSASIIVDLSDGKRAKQVEAIRKALDITKVETELPSGEKSSTSDIVVILGKN